MPRDTITEVGPVAEEAHQKKPVSLFYSYSHRDEGLRGALEAHLSFLRRSELISEWNDRMIGAGDEWKQQIDQQLEVADIILLLVSADFIASDYCWGEEMTKALARHRLGDARVIPVILRPCRWQSTALGSLQAVPKDGKPVSEWPNHDAAFNEIAAAIERTINNMHEQPRRAGEKAQQQTQEARKRAEAAARQAVEEQKRDAQQRREQEKARQAAEVEAARMSKADSDARGDGRSDPAARYPNAGGLRAAMRLTSPSQTAGKPQQGSGTPALARLAEPVLAFWRTHSRAAVAGAALAACLVVALLFLMPGEQSLVPEPAQTAAQQAQVKIGSFTPGAWVEVTDIDGQRQQPPLKGVAPFVFRAPVGATVTFTVRRRGGQAVEKEIRVTENLHEFTY